jgi:hypothetical protein
MMSKPPPDFNWLTQPRQRLDSYGSQDSFQAREAIEAEDEAVLAVGSPPIGQPPSPASQMQGLFGTSPVVGPFGTPSAIYGTSPVASGIFGTSPFSQPPPGFGSSPSMSQQLSGFETSANIGPHVSGFSGQSRHPTVVLPRASQTASQEVSVQQSQLHSQQTPSVSHLPEYKLEPQLRQPSTTPLVSHLPEFQLEPQLRQPSATPSGSLPPEIDLSKPPPGFLM